MLPVTKFQACITYLFGLICCLFTYVDDLSTGSGGDCSSDSESEERPAGLSCLVRIDSWVQFLGDPQAAQLALQLRHKLHALILRRLRAPNKPLTQVGNDSNDNDNENFHHKIIYYMILKQSQITPKIKIMLCRS